MLTDPIADMLTRIRNANQALHETPTMPASRMKVEIARLLKDEGYIKDYRVEKGEALRYPGRRAQVRAEPRAGHHRSASASPSRAAASTREKDRLPRVLGGMGTAIMSTSRVSCTSRTAQELGVGGEVLCFVW